MICKKCEWNRSHHNPFTKCPCQGEIRTNGRPIRRFKYAEFRLGYRKEGAIRREITNIDLGPCPYDGWNDKEYFRIYFK